MEPSSLEPRPPQSRSVEARPPEPRLIEDVYEPTTVRAIDGDPDAIVAHEAETLRGSRRAISGAAMLSASFTGVTEVFEYENEESIEELEDFNRAVIGSDRDPVTLYFVPNNPYLTRATVRPWLFETPTANGEASDSARDTPQP